MKTFLSSLLAACFLSLSLNAQSDLKVTYTAKVVSLPVDASDPAAAQQMMQAKMMLEGMKFTVYQKGKFSRTDVNMMMMNTSGVSNAAEKKVLVLIDAMGQKQAMLAEGSEYDSLQNLNQDVYTDFKYTGESKKILGYSVKKATVSRNGSSQELWVAPDLKFDATSMQLPAYQQEGLPLEMYFSQGGIKMKLEAIEILEKDLDPNLFDTNVPEGYTLTPFNKVGM